jgi:hypothetical protein
MKLMTKELEKTLPKLYSQENDKDPIAYVKYFDAMGSWNWYGFEYDPKEKLFFGYVRGFENELGYFSLDELESIGSRIERDLYFNPTPLSKIKEEL